MKKNEVQIGQCYMAKVTGSEVPLRIEAENQRGGWDARNVATGRSVRIKTAQRLRRKCTQADLAGLERPAPRRRKKTTSANTSPTVATGVKKAERSTNKAKTTTGATRAKNGAEKTKKISCIEAAVKVLGESSDPMNCKQMIEAMTTKGYWTSPGGKTPHATLYSAVLREIQKKGDDARFRKAERGKFALA